MKVCAIDGCESQARARGWCTMHWSRWRRTGDPEKLIDKAPPIYEHPDAKPGLCAVPDCGRPIRARSVCATHHQRWREHGDVQASVPVTIFGDDEARFWTNVDKRGPDDCWHWTGLRDPNGYGLFSAGQESRLVHRWSHKRFNGPVADDQAVDHTCHNGDHSCPRGPRCRHRRCVNPAHLEAVTPATNTHRAYGATEEVCGAGHPRTAENTFVEARTGGRRCRLCVRRAGRDYARRKRAERAES